MSGPATRSGVGGVVVLYHPDATLRDNIGSYVSDLDVLVVVDNTPVPEEGLRDSLGPPSKIVYLPQHRNVGIAAALNIGAREALGRGCRWLLTMDQDSRFPAGSLGSLLAAIPRAEMAGIISPRHCIPGFPESRDQAGLHEADVVMTSGNLLNLDAYREAGPFLEKLFIDLVDFDYCARLKRKGRRVWIAEDAELIHGFGKATSHRLFGRTLAVSNHPPARRYYMARNRLLMMRMHPGMRRRLAIASIKETLLLLLFEKDRMRKLAHAFRGVADFLRGRYGAMP
jgi:rhamnosyltransferase